MNNVIDLRNQEEEESVEEKENYLTINNVVDLRNQKSEEILEEKKEIIEGDEGGVEEERADEIDTEKRKFLKFLLIGTGTFVLGALTRFLGIGSAPQFLKNYANSENKEADFGDWKINEKEGENLESEKLLVDKENEKVDFGDWKIDKRENELVFTDKKANEEILILDWSNKDR